MIANDEQLKIPFSQLRGPKATIEGLSAAIGIVFQGGMIAFGWDTDPEIDGEYGVYDEVGGIWKWGMAFLPITPDQIQMSASPLKTLEDDHSMLGSSGVSDGTQTYILADSGAGTHHIKVIAGVGKLRTTNDQQGGLIYIAWAEMDAIEIPDPAAGQETTRFIGIEYNGGSPQVTVHTSFDWNWYTDFPLGRVSWDGTTLHILNAYAHAEDTANLTRQYLRKVFPFIRETSPEDNGGGIVTNVATRTLAVTAVTVHHGFNAYPIAAKLTTDVFDVHRSRAGGGFNTVTGNTQWQNTQIDDGAGGMTTMTNNKHANHWIYLDVSDGTYNVIPGRNQYNNAGDAAAEAEPPIPSHLQYHGKLVARLTFQKSVDIPDVITSMWLGVGGSMGGNFVASVTGDGVDNTDSANPVMTFPTPADIGAEVSGAAAAAIVTAEAYADGLVVGLWDDRGSFNASVNAYPSSGGSGTAGAIKKGDIWTVSAGGTLPTSQVVFIGSTVRALVDTPGNTQSNWAIVQQNIGYTPENAANKDVSGGYVGLDVWKIKFRNAANTFTSFLVNAATAARTYTFQDRDGTIADDTDITAAKARANHTGTQTASTISDFAATVLATVLTGLSTATNAVIAATDTVLVALGKLQAQITASGTWAAWTPTLTTGNADLSGYTTARYVVNGHACTFQFDALNKNVTGSAGSIKISLPFTAAAGAVSILKIKCVAFTGAVYVDLRADIAAGTAFVEIYKDITSASWLGSETGIYLFFNGTYEI